MSIDNLEARQERAERFRRFLEEEGFGEEIDGWEKRLTNALIDTDAKQDLERYRLQTAIVMCRNFRGWIVKAVTDGEITKPQLKEIAGGKRGFF